MEVGKRYRHGYSRQATCIAFDGIHAWMKEDDSEGGWITLASGWTEIREPREFWVLGGIAHISEPGDPEAIHVREVLPE